MKRNPKQFIEFCLPSFSKRLMLMVTLLLSGFMFVYAQKITVKGKVTDETKEGLIGVTVQVKGTATATSTDVDGNYTIEANKNEQLVFTFIGMKSQTVAVTSSNMNVQLESDSKMLTETVVIGYGTAQKRDLTGSIVKVGSADIANKPNSNPVASLQGKVAGLSIVNTGKPGADPDIRIRGTVSLNQTKPLYIIDGIFNDNMSFINPNDIESIEVLKDPSSLAIFGVRGANGVIIVTTKKGKEGKTIVNVNSSIGFKTMVGKPQLTDRAGFTALYDEQRANQGTTAYSDYDLFQGNTDWIDVISNKSAIVNANNISLSSGTDKNKLYMGASYLYEEGSVKYEKYKKIMLTVNDELSLSKKLKIGFNVNGSKADLPQLHDYTSAITATPIVEPYNETYGVYNKLPDEIGGPQIGNPLMFVKGNKYTTLSNEYRIIGNGFLEYNFLKDFTFKVNYYADLKFNDETIYTPKYEVYNAESNEVVDWNTKSSVEQISKRDTKYQQDYLLTYKHQFGDHNLTLLGGFTTYYEKYKRVGSKASQYAGGDPIPNEKRWWYVDVYPYGDPSSRVATFDTDTPSEWDRATVSELFRALYNYQGKYNLNASFRRDGSSEISPSHRYQNFWALGGAWYLTNEKFMSNQHVFDNLKLKASYGQLGNQYTDVHYPYYPNYTSGSSAVFGDNIVPAYVLAYINNPNLKWETLDEFDVGLESDLLHNGLHFEMNYYNKTSKDLLTKVNDGANDFYTNAGSVRSSGFEFVASWNQKIKKDFDYSISGNITTMKNKVVSVWKPGYVYTSGNSRTEEGQPIGYFYGYVVEGVYQSYADKLSSPINSLGDYGPGDLKFKDVNGDGKINSDDRTKIGNPTPDFTYGFSLRARYMNFDFIADFQGVYGNEVFRNWGNGSSYAVFNYRKDRLNRWNGAGTSNWEPQVNDNSAINKLPSTYMIEDGSYIRLRNIQLGYSFDKKMLSKLNISALRLYLSGQNLITWKHNSGFTPEAGGSAIEFGVDGGGYPIPAITSVGLNITF